MKCNMLKRESDSIVQVKQVEKPVLDSIKCKEIAKSYPFIQK